MEVSADDKQRFLTLVREGHDRATAALLVNPDYTGTMFRRLCSPDSRYYDPEFAHSYDEAISSRPTPLRARSEERDSTPTTPMGFTRAGHLTEEQIEKFLEHVRNGTQAAQAARELDPPTSITQINRRAKRDPEFAEEFREAMEEGVDAYKDNLRAEAARQAFAGDYRALRDQMLIHLEDARRALTTNRHEIGGFDGDAIRILAERHFAGLPRELLDNLIAEVERRERGELGSGSVGALDAAAG